MTYNKEKTKLLKKQKNYEELFAYLSEFAKSEIPEALNELAECYYWGLGTPTDYSQSFYYDNAAAILGNADSLAVLGFDYEHGVGVTVDQNKAVDLYQQAVSLGSTRGMTYLGLCFENGTGVNKDYEMAASLYLQAAEQGYARAQRFLGLCYEKGTGVPEDKCKAVYWYKKAAEQDNKIAQRWLAMCYEYGDGVDADISQAIEWYLRAIENDDDISRVNLACIYYDKFDDEEKDRIAISYLQIAVANLEKDSYHYNLGCFKLARYYENGYMVDCNPEKAFELDKVAAEGNILGAMLSVANCYDCGLGTPIDKVKAIKWYEKSAEFITNDIDRAECYLTIGDIINDNIEEEKEKANQFYRLAHSIYLKEAEVGNETALLQLGILFYDGKGCEKDYRKSFSCFEKLYIKFQTAEAGYYYATCFLRGIGVPKDEKKGFELLSKTYENHKAIPAALLLCYCYLSGIGVKANPNIAKKMLNFLLESFPNSAYVLNYTHLFQGIMYYHGIGEKQDIDIAKAHFKAAPGIGSLLYAPICEGNYEKATILGVIYSGNHMGINVPILSNSIFAQHFFELAYNHGVISQAGISGLCDNFYSKKNYKKAYEALLNINSGNIVTPKPLRLIGQHLYYGYGVGKNIDDAIGFFDRAYTAGDDVARVFLANCYANGTGVVKNYNTARKILEDTSCDSSPVSQVLRGLLIYSGNWEYTKDKEQGLVIIKENLTNSRYEMYYEFLSSARGDYYVDVFIDNHLANLYSPFSGRKKTKAFISQAIKILLLMIFKNPHSKNLSKKEMLRILLSQNQTLIDQGKGNTERQTEIASVLSQIQTNTDLIPQIIEQQKEMLGLLHTIIDYVSEQKKNLPSESSLRFLDETQVEQMQSRFIEETATKIIDSLQEKSVSVEKEEALLKGMFGEHWLKLDVYTRKSLLSARVLFNQCKGPEFASLDHSGVVVSATSALENELKRRLFTGFQTFMKNKLGTENYAEWPELLVFRSKKGDLLLNKSFPLGSLPYLFEGSDKDKKYLSEYLSSILSEQYADKGLLAFTTIKTGGDTFLNKCEKIRISFRNAAAHTGLVDRTKAEACCNAIIGPNEASEKIGQVQGLLYDLVQMTENYQ